MGSPFLIQLDKDLIDSNELCDVTGFVQLLLHWINDRQGSAEPELVVKALGIISKVATRSARCLDVVLQAGALQFLEDFSAQKGNLYERQIQDAINSLLNLPERTDSKSGGGGESRKTLENTHEVNIAPRTPAACLESRPQSASSQETGDFRDQRFADVAGAS